MAVAAKAVFAYSLVIAPICCGFIGIIQAVALIEDPDPRSLKSFAWFGFSCVVFLLPVGVYVLGLMLTFPPIQEI